MICITHPALGVPTPRVRPRLPEERVEQHRLPHTHVRGEFVVCPHVGHAIPQTAGGDRNAVEDDLAGEFEGPSVVRVGEDVADGCAFAL